jgi:hypothetical protein
MIFVLKVFASWDLGHEANPKSATGLFFSGGRDDNGPKVGKLPRKNMRKPHFREREGKKAK